MRFFRIITLFMILLAAGTQTWAQEEEKPKPDQLNIIKVNIFQLAVNEVRLLHEIQIGPKASMEVGLGYIYRNKFWYDRGGSTMLSSGFGGYFGLRKYFDKKRYIYQPFFRSYIGLNFFTRFTGFENEWLLFGSGDLDISYQCELFSQKIRQHGGTVRFGFQTRAGRLVLDMYTGVGMKVVPTVTTSHAINDCTRVCAIIPSTDIRDITSRGTEVEVVLNAGVQVGLRYNNREQNWKSKAKKEEDHYQEEPPKF